MKTVGVVGLGTIGLPLAVQSAMRGYNVIGLDIDPIRVQQINDGVVESIPLADRLASKERLAATTKPGNISICDIVIFCIPTPVDDKRQIQLQYLWAAAKSVAPHLRVGTLVILESSVEIGTTKVLANLLTENGAVDIEVAYCPERYDPSQPGKVTKWPYVKVPRVVGGKSDYARFEAQKFYSTILDAEVRIVGEPEVAEAAKLVENIFRDVNIALANELAHVLPTIGVNAHAVLDAAATKPYAFMRHSPGLVNGDCIPVDTWYLIRQAERAGVKCPLMTTAREVNDMVAVNAVNKVISILAATGRLVEETKVAILGTAYKENVADDRMTLQREIAESLGVYGVNVALVDPVMETSHRRRDTLVSIEDGLKGADVAILAVAHDVFLPFDYQRAGSLMRNKAIIDLRNTLSRKDAEAAGFTLYNYGEDEFKKESL